jgi:acetoacetyl-CoA synthetase
MTTPLWTPTAQRIDNSRMRHYMDWLQADKGLGLDSYDALWRWSIDDLEGFWDSIWRYFDVRGHRPEQPVLAHRQMPGARWFEGATLNYAEQALRWHLEDGRRPAIIARSQTRAEQVISWDELRAQVGAAAAAMRRMGVGPGDCVAAYLPNVPEAAVALLACASIGAVWSSCSPDMGTPSVVDRFSQIAPKLLLAVDGYRYGDKAVDRADAVEQLRRALPSVQQVVSLPYLHPSQVLPGTVAWPQWVADPAELAIEPVDFSHPFWVVYSSGTTGMPKPLVHGQGGVVLEHLKALGLQLGLGPDDRYCWFSSTGWVMWNIGVGGLLVGSTVVVYDGNPGHPDLGELWRMAAQLQLSALGAGAAFFGNCMKGGVQPSQIEPPHRLRWIGSTGSPLSPEAHDWLAEQLGPETMIASISGGTDVATFFLGPTELLPVHSGRIPCPALGVAARAFDDHGRPVVAQVGELVITEPMPSMPLYFWGEPDGRRYHESYFDVYPGIWRHGDWIEFNAAGESVIFGRSDTTINRFGVRMGTAEIYRAVEVLPEVIDSLVVDLEYLGRESFMPLFVVLAEGARLDAGLIERINASVRQTCSPRHVPSTIIEAPQIPRTLTGKKMELPVRKLLLGAPPEKVANPDAMANPQSLQFYVDYARSRQG